MDKIYSKNGTPLDVQSNKYKLKISSLGRIDDDIDSVEEDGSEYDLCAFRYKFIGSDYIPVIIGWLYQKSPKNENGCELWYSANQLDKPKLLTTMTGIKPNDSFRSFVISPMHGDIITCKMDNRNKPVVYDKSNDTSVTIEGLETNPIGWLGSSGCDFGVDSLGNEFFMFGEYTGNGSSVSGYESVNIWKVTYPYSTASNWNIVKTVTRASSWTAKETGKVWHFHTVMRDPYTNIWYATTGDEDAATIWWYSDDDGDTWVQLLEGTSWLSQTARLLNYAFDKDYIWWANDYGTNHSINRVSRTQSGLIDINSHEVVIDLDGDQSTYATIFLSNPHGLLMIDRVDTAFGEHTNELTMQFYSIDDGNLYNLKSFKRMENSPNNYFGFRCKCYTLRQSPYDPRIGVGFDVGSLNYVEMNGNENNSLWTIFFEVS